MFRKPLLILLILPLLLTACQRAQPVPPTFQATTSRADVDIRSLPQENGVTFHIFSPKGIGDATFTLSGGDMPDTIQVRLYVDNLDQLILAYDDLRIEISAPRTGALRETLHMAGGTANLDPSSPYWVDIQPLPAEPGALLFGKPGLPASYLITLPQDFHWGNHTSFTLQWIDYYR